MRELPDLTRQYETSKAAADFTDFALCLARKQHPSTYPERFKNAVSALSTSTTPELLTLSRAFIDVVQRFTVLGKMAGAWVPTATGTTPVDSTVEDVFDWVSETSPAPVARLAANAGTQLLATKLALITAFSQELVKLAEPRGRRMIEARFLRALRRAEDQALLGTTAASAGTNPAGLLYGLTPIVSGSPGSLTDDLAALWTEVSFGDPDRPFFITSPRVGMYLAALRQDGSPLFPDVGPLGGSIAGVTVLTSRAAGNALILLDAAHLAVADDGVLVEQSTQASVQMDDAPSGAAHLVSAFQANLAFLKFTRFINWQLTSDRAIAYLELAELAGSPA